MLFCVQFFLSLILADFKTHFYKVLFSLFCCVVCVILIWHGYSVFCGFAFVEINIKFVGKNEICEITFKGSNGKMYAFSYQIDIQAIFLGL